MPIKLTTTTYGGKEEKKKKSKIIYRTSQNTRIINAFLESLLSESFPSLGVIVHLSSLACPPTLHWALDVMPGQSESEVAQSCSTLCDPMDCSLPGSSVHGIFQAIVLEWITISLSRGSSQPRVEPRSPTLLDRCCTIWATRDTNLVLLLCVLASNVHSYKN